ncbi:hypothetical protein [Neomoorella thermoacetica]|uniref:hypothetical protein n=1 Tax=Neomoorella thermoacetica TaxID=1525 RepID=UPI0011E68BC5|nr:hypothetical protein [Moorella thermoacetica]
MAIAQQRRGKTIAALLAAKPQSVVCVPTYEQFLYCMMLVDILAISPSPHIYPVSQVFIGFSQDFPCYVSDNITEIILDEPHLMFSIQDLVKWRQKFPGIVKVIGTEPQGSMYYSLLGVLGWDVMYVGEGD